jgi:fibro-slime domain-containing protein
MQLPLDSRLAPLALLLVLMPACAASDDRQTHQNGAAPVTGGPPTEHAPASSSNDGAGTLNLGAPPAAAPDDTTSAGGTVRLGSLPPGASIAANVGRYMLGPKVTAAGVADTGLDAGAGCSVIAGVVRDFRGVSEPGGHADFEVFSGWNATLGLVGRELGRAGKPVYTSKCQTAGVTADCPFGQQTTSAAAFDQWYRYAEGVNQPYLIYFEFAPSGGSIVTFDSQLFFPLDGQGFGNSGTGEDGKSHNFHFTTELHTKFKYNGGETFKFSGDDDLWIFINGKLVLDVGGLHPAVSQAIDMDAFAQALGMTQGNVYSLELFHAERHTIASHFRVDSTLTFVDCGTVPAEVVK